MKKLIIILMIFAGAISSWAIGTTSSDNPALPVANKSAVTVPQEDIARAEPLKLQTNNSDQPVISAVTCPPGSETESETCGDNTNGGCLMDYGEEVFESIDCGQTFCGTYWSDEVTRDLDWYELVLTERGFIKWQAVGEAPTRIWMYDGSAGCTDPVYLASVAADPEDTAWVELELMPGTYYLVVGPDDWYDMPCDGSGDYGNDYVAALSCELGTPILTVDPDSVHGVALEGFTDNEIITVANTGEGRLVFTSQSLQDFILTAADEEHTVNQDKVDVRGLLAAEKPSDIDEIYANLPVKIPTDAGDLPVAATVECPPDGTPEMEACGSDVNGGCAMSPGTESYETLSCNTTVCGTAWSDGTTRDTDWFTLHIDEATLFTWEVTADFPLMTLIILPGTSPNECFNYEALLIDVADPGDTAKIVTSLAAGTYWFWVGPTAWYNMPCDGSGDYTNDYVASLKCEPPWLSIDAVSGVIHEGDSPIDINILLDATHLMPGMYTGKIRFNSNDYVNSPLDVPVSFLVREVYQYIPGDANMGVGTWPAVVTGADVTYLSNFFLQNNPSCEFEGFYAAADVNGDCRVIGSDVTYLVRYFRTEGPAPQFCPDFPHIPPVEDNYPACDIVEPYIFGH